MFKVWFAYLEKISGHKFTNILNYCFDRRFVAYGYLPEILEQTISYA